MSGETSQAEKLAALHERLAEQIAQLRSSEGWRRWLDVAARFHTYSFGNTVLILAQRPDATLVAGYESWKSFGRQVSRGERGLQILAPVIRHRHPDRASSDESDPEQSQATDQRTSAPPLAKLGIDGAKDKHGARHPYVVAGFRVTYVWDVAQTTGTPLPEPPRPSLLAGEAPPGLWDALADAVERSGYRLQRAPCPSGANGVTDPLARTVTIRPNVDEAQAVKTLAHELAHVRLHADTTPENRVTCRGVVEVEAESVAYLVAAAHALDTSTYSFPYVATWAEHAASAGVGDERGRPAQDIIRATAERVLGAANGILQDVELALVSQQRIHGQRHDHRSTGTQDLVERVAAGVVRSTAARARSEHVDQQTARERPKDPRQPQRRGREGSRPADGPVDRDRLIAANGHALDYFVERVGDSWVLGYLEQRRLTTALEHPWAAGYAPRRWTGLVDRLREHGYTDDDIFAAGLAIRARTGNLVDRFRDRLVLPFADARGEVVGFIGRAHPDADAERNPKYMNSPTTAVFSKGDQLYGLGPGLRLLQEGARPVLVEGPLDAIAVSTGTDGRCVGVAPSGTALTPRQVELLAGHVDLARDGLTVAFDSDPAGERAAETALGLLAVTGLDPHVALFAEHKDPSEFLAQEGTAALTRVLTEGATLLSDRVLNRQLLPLLQADGAPPSSHDLRSVGNAVAALPPAAALRQSNRVAAQLGVNISHMRTAVLEALIHPASTGARPSRRS